MKKIIPALLYFLLFYSCNTEDFNLSKLSTSDLKPKVYLPLAYGTFSINGYLPSNINLGADDAVISIPEIELIPLIWRKGDFSLPKNTLDSTYIEITVTNSSPMQAQFDFFSVDWATKAAAGRTYSGVISPASANSGPIQPTIKKFVYPLSLSDLEVISTTDGLKCVVTLLAPGTPVIVKNVKDSDFKIQVNFCSRISLSKI